jgi:hydroxyquinol 1,2-dioxygenase
MRGLYHSQQGGSYAVRRVGPIGYTVPMDGTVGELLNRAKISHMRPAHV